jgi:hypothetical protein
MSGKTVRAAATDERKLVPERASCVECGQPLRVAYTSRRKVATLKGMVGLTISIGRCENLDCGRYHRPYHPAAEGSLALRYYEYGLDVLAFIGAHRYQECATAPQIHAALVARGVGIGQRNVQYLLERYDELVTLSVRADPARRERLNAQGRLILAVDGLQPEVGNEVLWVVREVLSGEVLLAQSLLSSCQADLARLLREAVEGLTAPVVGVVSDGQHSIQLAVAQAFPGVPHQLCQFHYLKQAAGPAWEADRHAKKELKKKVRGIRPLERQVEDRDDEEGRIVQDYCAAVRGALADDGKSPLEPGGIRLHERLEAINASLDRADKKGKLPKPLSRMRGMLHRALEATAHLWPSLVLMFSFIAKAAVLLDNPAQQAGEVVRAHYQEFLKQLADACAAPTGEGIRGWGARLQKITQSYWAGLFHCYDIAGLSRTNNDLEQFFGRLRHQERRITGRKRAPPSLIVRGAVRVIAAVVSWAGPVDPLRLADVDPLAWREERRQLRRPQRARVLQRKFRRDPDGFLEELEERLVKLILPP